ncbi:MAG: hypothetical protein O2818_09605 [Bacteroidetes bacterium]|nr:hypothetical protein [Bacteroidota bacterium]
MIAPLFVRSGIAFVALCLSLLAHGQQRVEVYEDHRMMWQNMMLHAENGVIRSGQDWRGEVIWTTLPGKIFQGYSTSTFDLLYSVREQQLIQGDSHFSDAILYTAESNGNEIKLYIGDSTFPLDLVYTIRPNAFNDGVFELYKEDSISQFDRILVLRGLPSAEELYAILLALGLL